MDKDPATSIKMNEMNSIIENIFLITLNPNCSNNNMVYMAESSDNNQLWTVELLELNLFERLMTMSEDSSNPENKIVAYLYSCFTRNEDQKRAARGIWADTCDKLQILILRNLSTTLKQPDLFPGQNLSDQFLDIFKDIELENTELRDQFLSQAIATSLEDNDTDTMQSLKEIFFKCFDEVAKNVRKASMMTLEKWTMSFLMAFVSDKQNSKMAEILLEYTTPPADCEGIKYSESLIGQLLCLSLTPKNNSGPYEYYENLHNTNIQALNNLSSSLWNYLKMHLDAIHLMIKGFLMIGGDVKEKILTWLGNSISSNEKRGQIWSNHSSMVLGNYTTAPDSFMIGLCGVLLRLCQPLVRPQFKVLLADPTYSAVKNDEAAGKQVHLKDVEKETCLIAFEEDEKRITADKYNFVTELFFMTHKTIDLGYRVCIEKVMRMNREIGRLQNAYQDAMGQGGNRSDVTENILQTLSSQSQQFLCLQNLILEPRNDELLLQFYEATAIWLNQLSTRSAFDENATDKSFAPQTAEPITLPLANDNTIFLKYVPEFMIENVVGYLQFARHFDVQAIKVDQEAKNSIITMILIFMGNSKRAKNPHLRAHLAEGMESLLPRENQNGFQMNGQLFLEHAHRLHMVENLLNVFVSIEFSGQSVQFEQKFNYRRPMYAIIDYLWKIPEQRECFKRLSLAAVTGIDDMEAPIFLRFINVLINDSIFLLDESLNNIQQIRELETARDNNEWSTLPQAERRQNISNLQHVGMLARFDNILGRDTINVLKLLTSESKGIFCHSSMVDRVAAMLNYFLLHLVGPKKENFKVKDKKEFEFDPAHTVKEICAIYLNLKDCEEFCLAVSQDGRSYSPELFQYAENILIRIGGGNLVADMTEFADKVKQIELKQRLNDEALINPPDDFLDPIMSTLMRDPVILPSSKITIDRTTISRHLLSDQTDPFNRAPLSMDMLRPDTDLKEKIDLWIAEKLLAYNEKN